MYRLRFMFLPVCCSICNQTGTENRGKVTDTVEHPPLAKHIGNRFDDFLAEEGLLAEVDTVAQKRVIVFQLTEELQRRGWTRAELANRLGTPGPVVERLLDPEDLMVDLQLLGRAADLLGKRLRITLR